MKKLFLFLTILIIFLSQTAVVGAYEYGGGEPSRQIIIDKQLKPSRWEAWEDNLIASEYNFVAGEKIDFKIVVKNTGR